MELLVIESSATQLMIEHRRLRLASSRPLPIRDVNHHG
jgi:hypothetical protein